jgi:hypothetical protein
MCSLFKGLQNLKVVEVGSSSRDGACQLIVCHIPESTSTQQAIITAICFRKHKTHVRMIGYNWDRPQITCAKCKGTDRSYDILRLCSNSLGAVPLDLFPAKLVEVRVMVGSVRRGGGAARLLVVVVEKKNSAYNSSTTERADSVK